MIAGTPWAALAAAAVVIFPSVAGAQLWQPFAGGSVFSSAELTNTAVVEDQARGVAYRPVEFRTGYTVGGTAGVFVQTSRSQNIGSYSVGFATTDDFELRTEDLQQQLQLAHQSQLGARWTLTVTENLFWGVLRIEQDLDPFGAAVVPALGDIGAESTPRAGDAERGPAGVSITAPPAGPSTPLPGGTSSGAAGEVAGPEAVSPAESVVDSYAIHTIRYVRSGTGLGAFYRPNARWGHGFNLGLSLQHFIDRDIIRTFQLPLLNNYGLLTSYQAAYQPNGRLRWTLAAESVATWFSAGEGRSTEGAERIALRLDMQSRIAPRWTFGAGGGLEAAFSMAAPSERSLIATGTTGLGYRFQRWSYSANLFRAVQQSEIGGIFVNTGGRLQLNGRPVDDLAVTVSGQTSRQDVAVLVVIGGPVLAPGPDAEADDNINLGDLGGWTLRGGLQLDYSVNDRVSIGVGYNANWTDRDSSDTLAQVSHRVLVGLIVGTGGR